MKVKNIYNHFVDIGKNDNMKEKWKNKMIKQYYWFLDVALNKDEKKRLLKRQKAENTVDNKMMTQLTTNMTHITLGLTTFV